MAWHLKHQEQEKYRELLRRRYEQRQRVDELLLSLLSGSMVEEFADIKPSDFEKYILPVDFQDHCTYREKWEKLFFYEVFCFLVNNQRRSDIEEQQQKALAQDQGQTVSSETFKRHKRAMKWVGYVQTSTNDMLFQQIKMFEVPPVVEDPNEDECDSKKDESSKETEQ